jgi:hypothetical protein
MTKTTGGAWWIKQRHDNFEVVQSTAQPAMETQKGERQHAIRGPFKTKEEAEELKDKLYSKTLKAISERNA